MILSCFSAQSNKPQQHLNFLAYLRSGTALPFLTFVLFVIRNLLLHSKVRFEKKAQCRVDKPDYSERAVTEALVNALIHRDYLVMGSEVHIDMYDDRLEIYFPGGMYRGKPIQECGLDEIDSVRRNPVIADLFHRMKFMYRPFLQRWISQNISSFYVDFQRL